MVSSDYRSYSSDKICYGDQGSARGDSSSVAFYTSADPEDQRTFRAAAERLGLSFEDLAVFCRRGFKYEQIPVSSGERWNLLLYLKRAGTAPAKWVMISGLYPDVLYSEGERRKRLRALHRATVLLIKRALGRAGEDPFRAERLKKILKGRVRAFVKGWIAHRATLVTEKQGEVNAFEVWKALKASGK